jgi:3-methylcrotonyl-CoA carboxylase alpha subunit
MADQAVHIGGAAASESYLRGDVIIQAALDADADAIHPGYGFLSKNAAFADAVEAAGLIFVGPRGDSIRAMAPKDAAKRLMEHVITAPRDGVLTEIALAGNQVSDGTVLAVFEDE